VYGYKTRVQIRAVVNRSQQCAQCGRHLTISSTTSSKTHKTLIHTITSKWSSSTRIVEFMHERKENGREEAYLDAAADDACSCSSQWRTCLRFRRRFKAERRTSPLSSTNPAPPAAKSCSTASRLSPAPSLPVLPLSLPPIAPLQRTYAPPPLRRRCWPGALIGDEIPKTVTEPKTDALTSRTQGLKKLIIIDDIYIRNGLFNMEDFVDV
jgi:hypothetical protein